MKPAPLAYLRPANLTGAVNLFRGHDGEARYIAGGQSLVPMLNLRLAQPDLLIDLDGLEALKGIREKPERIAFGAMTTHADLLEWLSARPSFPLLLNALRHVAHPAIRNRGTIGGSCCHADPAAEIPACCLALDAVMVISNGRNTRRVKADAFFLGLFETALKPGEILVAIEIEPSDPGVPFGFDELARRSGDYASAGVAMRGGGDPRFVMFGVSDRPVRARAAEQAYLAGKQAREIASLAGEGIAFQGDLHAPEDVKRHYAKTLVRKVITSWTPPS